MALTGTDRGTGSHNTTATTLAVVPASNLAAGSMAVLIVAADNTGASGAYSITTCTDTKGNGWTRQQSPLYDPGAAAAGVQGAIFTTLQNGGALTTGDTITVTFSVTTVAKAWTLMEVVPAATYTVGYVSGGVNAGAASAAPTVTTGSIASANMVIGGLFNEYGTAQVVTEDGDSTNGSWSTQQTTDVGLTTSGVGVSSQRKVVTATATQTFDPTLLTSSDVILAWVELAEIVPRCYRDAVRLDSPVAYWRLGEASGTNADNVIGTLDGTYVGGPTLGEPGALAGDSDKAVKFVDATDYVTVPDNAVLDLGDGPFSVELWVKRTSTLNPGYCILVSKQTQGNVFFVDDKFTFDNDSNPTAWESGTTADAGVWHHFVVTHLVTGAGNTRIYKDSVDVTVDVTPANVNSSNAANMSIGIYNDLAFAPSLATIDELAIYNVALTAGQVAAHYLARTAVCVRVPRFTPYPQLLAH